MEFVEGRIFTDLDLPGLSPDERSEAYSELVKVLARLHKLDPNKVNLGNYGKGANYYERQIKTWATQYKATETETIK